MTILSVPLSELRKRQSLKWQVYDPDVLPMWVAEMDVLPHPEVLRTVKEALTLGDTGYPHGTGYAEAFAAMAHRRWGWTVDPQLQIRRAGDVMNTILTVLDTVTSPGDAVVINPPVYPPFRQVVTGYGRRVVEVPLTAAGRLDLEALADAFSGPERPTAYLLCSPHNPTGTIHTATELRRVFELAAANQVQVIVDEIHQVLVDPGSEFTPALAVPGSERVVVVTSAGKAWNLAGFKSGLVITGSDRTPLLDQLPPLALHASGHLANLAHTAALIHAQEWVDQLMAEIVANKGLLARALSERLPELSYLPQPGTYLAWVDASSLGLADPAAHFAEVARVAFSPGVNFGNGHQQWVRVNLACSPQVILEAVDRMRASV